MAKGRYSYLGACFLHPLVSVFFSLLAPHTVCCLRFFFTVYKLPPTHPKELLPRSFSLSLSSCGALVCVVLRASFLAALSCFCLVDGLLPSCLWSGLVCLVRGGECETCNGFGSMLVFHCLSLIHERGGPNTGCCRNTGKKVPTHPTQT